MNNGNFNKIFSDAMNLFNTFGVFSPPQPPVNQNLNLAEIRPQLPSLSNPNLNNRDIKKTNEYYLSKIKNFLYKQF